MSKRNNGGKSASAKRNARRTTSRAKTQPAARASRKAAPPRLESIASFDARRIVDDCRANAGCAVFGSRQVTEVQLPADASFAYQRFDLGVDSEHVYTREHAAHLSTYERVAYTGRMTGVAGSADGGTFALSFRVMSGNSSITAGHHALAYFPDPVLAIDPVTKQPYKYTIGDLQRLQMTRGTGPGQTRAGGVNFVLRPLKQNLQLDLTFRDLHPAGVYSYRVPRKDEKRERTFVSPGYLLYICGGYTPLAGAGVSITPFRVHVDYNVTGIEPTVVPKFTPPMDASLEHVATEAGDDMALDRSARNFTAATIIEAVGETAARASGFNDPAQIRLAQELAKHVFHNTHGSESFTFPDAATFGRLFPSASTVNSTYFGVQLSAKDELRSRTNSAIFDPAEWPHVHVELDMIVDNGVGTGEDGIFYPEMYVNSNVVTIPGYDQDPFTPNNVAGAKAGTQGAIKLVDPGSEGNQRPYYWVATNSPFVVTPSYQNRLPQPAITATAERVSSQWYVGSSRMNERGQDMILNNIVRSVASAVNPTPTGRTAITQPYPTGMVAGYDSMYAAIGIRETDSLNFTWLCCQSDPDVFVQDVNIYAWRLRVWATNGRGRSKPLFTEEL